jgi:hypothetical protein
MILVDISGLLHKAAYASTKNIPAQSDLIHIDMYKHYFIDNVLSELIETQLKYRKTYGELVICFDYKGFDSYWRKDIYPAYKGQRKAIKDKQKFDYNDVYKAFEELKEQLVNNTPWKCITVNRAEADDTILILAREFGFHEKTLIYSADKDMIQAQHNNPKIDQYSHQTKKWLTPEDKYDDMSHWFLEHQCLGDKSDNVFHILTNTEFSVSFIAHLESFGIKDLHPVQFRENKTQIQEKHEALSTFNTFKKLKADQIEPTLDVYKDIGFGTSKLDKAIAKFGSLEKLLESNPLIKANYELNYELVMEEGIPEYIWKDTLVVYNGASTNYNESVFSSYLIDLGLHQCQMDLQKVFIGQSEEISIDNCGW